MKGKNTHEVSNNFFNQVKENGMHDCHEDTTDKAQKRGRVSINNRSHSWCFLTFKYCSYAVSCYTVKVFKWEKKEKVSTFLTKVGSSNYALENAQLIDWCPIPCMWSPFGSEHPTVPFGAHVWMVDVGWPSSRKKD